MLGYYYFNIGEPDHSGLFGKFTQDAENKTINDF